MPNYITFSDEIPLEKKLLVVSSLKIPQNVLERMAMDIRKNKPREETPTAERQRAEA
ncbi:hypothetical protein OB236_38490 [Paenibacillus sp. WQ 127069]|uniref:Uncharacterized protein n=1 Tax=Paenibacillus baimaensis TaxID=2982185 RepID=A0ABT2UTP0_9BACL|nr:hypothetical protein [Paenibacillus sp. WQ 127069]MCU6798031.1 hypothetical protein [Paenibacillus sp. WQ 127069]